jgi:hypothetical protein
MNTQIIFDALLWPTPMLHASPFFLRHSALAAAILHLIPATRILFSNYRTLIAM